MIAEIYREEDYLQLSGIQHFAFCRRQWALIHLEDLWYDNEHTVAGEQLHERAHDADFSESRGDVYIQREVSFFSATLGVSGKCDVLEFHRCREDGITLHGREGAWLPYPVEYKKGSSKLSDVDRLQLCGQAMCLEEMLCCAIPEGALFYGETRRREVVPFTSALRHEVQSALAEMHDYAKRGYTPKVKPHKGCHGCSLQEFCMPRMQRCPSVAEYLRASGEEANL